MEDAIDRYMRELSDSLLLTGRERARALEEVEGQLRELEGDIAGAGAAPADALADAVARLDEPAEIAARLNHTSLRAQLHGLPWYLAVFVGAGFLTIGASSLLTSLLSMSFSARSSGAAGAMPRGARGFEEFIGSFTDGAALSALMLGGASLLRRRDGERGARARLALGMLALAAFGATALLLIPLGLWQIVRYPGTGGGYWLASGLAAIGALLVFVSWRTFGWRNAGPTGRAAAA